MSPLLAYAGRIVLVLALVLAGPGMTARAMASGHGDHEATRTVNHELSDGIVAVSSTCHDEAPSGVDSGGDGSRPHAPGHADPEADTDPLQVESTAMAVDECCSGDAGCVCDCMHLTSPAATSRMLMLAVKLRPAPANAMGPWRLVDHQSRLNRPPIA